MSRLPVYVLVTPVRNEERFIELTLRSVTRQTVKPLRWVIADDGSTDGTGDVVRRYAASNDWIELVTLPERSKRSFSGKVSAFNAGYARLRALSYEVIGNLDGDVSFDDDYLEFLLEKFATNPALGVVGTPYREERPLHDERFKSPDHVSGACQLFRRRCFEEIGGYVAVESGGIDFIAVLSAQSKGWETRRFEERACFHHRNVGSGQDSGVWRRLFNLGRKDYLLGSHPGFELFRCLFKATQPPYLIGGGVVFAGYLAALASRAERSMPAELIRLRRTDQLQRLRNVLLHPVRLASRLKSSTAAK